jgi:uncharacterized Zn-finger protein
MDAFQTRPKLRTSLANTNLATPTDSEEDRKVRYKVSPNADPVRRQVQTVTSQKEKAARPDIDSDSGSLAKKPLNQRFATTRSTGARPKMQEKSPPGKVIGSDSDDDLKWQPRRNPVVDPKKRSVLARNKEIPGDGQVVDRQPVDDRKVLAGNPDSEEEDERWGLVPRVIGKRLESEEDVNDGEEENIDEGYGRPSSGSPTAGTRVGCRYCGRRFAADRIAVHERVCAKSQKAKKRVFDARKQRLAGTGADNYADGLDDSKPTKPKNNNRKYKIEHEKLVNALRSAREYTAYESAVASGKPANPPPKIPSYEMDDDDRIPCPHCGRKFAAEAAARHVPACERMNHGRTVGSHNNGGRGGARRGGW